MIKNDIQNVEVSRGYFKYCRSMKNSWGFKAPARYLYIEKSVQEHVNNGVKMAGPAPTRSQAQKKLR